MIHVWRDHEHARFLACILGALDCHLFQLQNVDVVELLKQFYLSEGGDGEAIFLVVHQDLLQSDYLACLFRFCLGDLAEGAFAQLAHVFVLLDLGAAMKARPAIIQSFQ